MHHKLASVGAAIMVLILASGAVLPAFATIPSSYVPLTPARLLDSRNGTGLSGAFASHVARTFAVTGQGGVPANATAVTGNLTVTSQTALGFLYLGPVAMDNPTSSTLNFPLGDDRANGVTVALSGTGTLSVTYASPVGGATAQVLFDVTGYFVPASPGATGPAGADGATGPAGAVGATGATGAVGPAGAAGLSGSAIVQGPTAESAIGAHAGTFIMAEAACPAGKALLGGGGAVGNGDAQGKTVLAASYPNSATSWMAMGVVIADLAYNKGMAVYVYAVCSQ